MSDYLDNIWQSAQLWPAGSTSYLTHLREAQSAISDCDLHQIANLNLYASSARDNLIDLRARRIEAFSALCQRPCTEHAEQAYHLLVAHKDCEVDVLTPVKTDKSYQHIAGSFLLFVLLNSPHKVAVKNAIVLLAETETIVDTDVRRICSADSFLIHHLFPLPCTEDLPATEKQALMRNLAENGSFDSQEYLYEHFTEESPDELRYYLLRHAQFAAEPSFKTYDGFDVGYSPEFHAAILEFAQRTELAKELNAKSIDDQLVTAALYFFSNLSACWREGVAWSVFEAAVPATQMLDNLVEHLEGRTLSLENLEELADIFDTLFSDSMTRVEAEPNKQIPNDRLIASQVLHLAIAAKISAVLHAQPHAQLLENALSSMTNPDFDEAMHITLMITRNDPFEVVFPFLEKELPRKPNMRVSHSAMAVCFNFVKHDRRKAQRLADWCADYCRFERSGGYIPGPSYEFILSNALRMVKLFPGVGKGMILAGLNAQSPTVTLAAEVLSAWPVEHWPTNISWRIDSAIAQENKTLAILTDALQKLPDSSN